MMHCLLYYYSKNADPVRDLLLLGLPQRHARRHPAGLLPHRAGPLPHQRQALHRVQGQVRCWHRVHLLLPHDLGCRYPTPYQVFSVKIVFLLFTYFIQFSDFRKLTDPIKEVNWNEKYSEDLTTFSATYLSISLICPLILQTLIFIIPYHM